MQLRQLLRTGFLGEAERKAASTRVKVLSAKIPEINLDGSTDVDNLDDDVVFVSTVSDSKLLPESKKPLSSAPVATGYSAVALVRHATSLHVQVQSRGLFSTRLLFFMACAFQNAALLITCST